MIVPSSAAARRVAAGVVESYVGATLEAPGILNNDAINFVLTAAAAAFAVFFVRLT